MKFNWIFSQFWLYIYYKFLSGQLKIIIKFKIPFSIMWLKTINYIHHHINLWATCSKSCSSISILQYWMIMFFSSTPKYYNYKNSTQLKIINNLGQIFFLCFNFCKLLIFYTIYFQYYPPNLLHNHTPNNLYLFLNTKINTKTKVY